jgi:hypothetical protein
MEWRVRQAKCPDEKKTFAKIAAPYSLNITNDDSNFWRCSSEFKCLLLPQVCDGEKDCAGGEDESFCLGWNQQSSYLPYDGDHLKQKDSNSGWHRNSHVHCPNSYYRCQNGQCIHQQHVAWYDNKKLDGIGSV